MEPSVHEFVKFVEVNKHISTKNEMIAAVSSRFAMARDGRALFHTWIRLVIAPRICGPTISGAVSWVAIFVRNCPR